MTIVIVGGGLAGLRSAENLRTLSYEGRILVISDEIHMPYNRPPLSKELLWGEATSEDLVFEVSQAAFDVEWKLGARVESVDLDAKTLKLDSGEIVDFEGLIIASGVRSRRLPIPGPTEGRTVVRSLDEAVALRERLSEGKRFVSLGAGFIGCEIANTALKFGCEVDIVAIDPVPMKMPLGEMVGAEVQRRHEAAGIRFHMGRSIVETRGDGKIEEVVLDDGTVLPADILLETVGSVPATDWLEGNDLDLKNGVLTDENLRAGGRPGVVVVGDVARFENPLFKAPALRFEHLQTAIDTAAIATRTLLKDLGVISKEAPVASIMPWFWSDQGEVRMTSYGMLGLADRQELLEGELDGECAVGYYRGEEAVGVLLIGLKSKAAKFKRWLEKERKAANAPAHTA